MKLVIFVLVFLFNEILKLQNPSSNEKTHQKGRRNNAAFLE